MRHLNPVSLCFLILAAFSLSACVASGYQRPAWTYNPDEQGPPAQQPPSDLSETAPLQPTAPAQPEASAIADSSLRAVKIGVLLPLSGQHADLGQAMLQAAQMALFDAGYENFEMLPRDTAAEGGARAAAQQVVSSGAELVLGPVFSADVQAAKSVVQGAGVNMIAYSTDWGLAGGNTFIMGFMPFDQVERITQYAARQNLGRVGVIAPSSDYGRVVVSAFDAYSRKHGVRTAKVENFPANGSNLTATVRNFTNYDARQAGSPELPFEAVLMPVGGSQAALIGNLLNQYDMPPNRIKRLGTGLFDDPSLAAEGSLSGAWFAAPDPKDRTSFERRFQKNYGYTPPRLASLAYDSTALAAILAKRGLQAQGKPMFDANSITNPNGFAGIDGIFRFRADGTVERGLAVLEFRNGSMRVIDSAPRTFEEFTRF